MLIEDISIGERYRKDLGDIGGLAKSIQEIGLLHPVVVTSDGQLVAGQRRLAAARQLGWEEIPARVVDLQSIVRGEYDENAIRKDFLPSEAFAIGRVLEPLERMAALERQQEHGGTAPGVNKNTSGNLPEVSGQSRDAVASKVGMGSKSYEKLKQVMIAAEEEPEKFADLAKEMDRTGKIDGAYKKFKHIKTQEVKKEKASSLPQGTYNVIYADPPWQYNNSIGKWGPANSHYSTMPTADICALSEKIELSIAENAVLFLWATNPFLEDALQVIDSWGFEYKTNIVWVKTELQKPGSGFYVRGRHELLLIATKGSFTPLDQNISPPIGSVIESPVQEHSKKPGQIYEIIEKLYPKCNYIELFARNKKDGWQQWGDEVPA